MKFCSFRWGQELHAWAQGQHRHHRNATIAGVLRWTKNADKAIDHVIFVGEVEHCSHRAGAAPLLFHGGRFYTEHPL